ncbi:MAG: S8 family serine peptidase [Armatimonadetes bacterium]|nr:S8 family serine peptidase [Armatimonadota bacterium]
MEPTWQERSPRPPTTAIINMSLGGPFPSKVLADACNYAHRKGVLIICAAGNSSSSWVSYPAAYPVCVAVSAVRYDKTLAFYSNRGRRIDIAAPGGDMNVDQNGDGYKDGVLQNTIAIRDPSREDYSLFQGTSMASPHVAGSAALVMSLGVTNPWEVKKVLFSTAQTPPEERSKGYGAGILNANSAVQRVVLWRGVKKVLIALFFLVALFLLRKKLPRLITSLCCGTGLLAGSSGFFFLPFFTEIPAPVAPFLTRGLGDWDIFWLGAQAHGHPLFYSAFAPLILAALFHKWRIPRAIVAGFSAGVASVIVSCLFAPSVMGHSFPLPIEKLWLLVNGIACFGLGLSLVSKEDKT